MHIILKTKNNTSKKCEFEQQMAHVVCSRKISVKRTWYIVLTVFNIVKFVPNKEHSQTTFCFHSKKTAPESCWLFQETYGKHASLQDTVISMKRRCQIARIVGWRRRTNTLTIAYDIWERFRRSADMFSREKLSHAAYSPDLALSDYHLFASMGPALAEQHFTSSQPKEQFGVVWKMYSS